MSGERYSVAIVGLGPRGTYALERLLAHAGDLPRGTTLAVTAFEPHPAPGAGPVYDPAAPEYLRMNFAAEMVDMWWPGEPRSTAPRAPFERWRAEPPRNGLSGERYPPRAEVGAYLGAGLSELLVAAPQNVELELVRARVERLRRSARGWRVAHEGPGSGESRFDQVLLCTGHLAEPARGNRSFGGLQRVESVYPVERLAEPRVPAGSAVAIRGFALTFIDAALALTEGRGGSFGATDGGGPAPGYERTGREPVSLLPFSRSGRPMLAKPDPDMAPSIAGVAEVAAEGRERLIEAPDPVDLDLDLLPVLIGTARRMLLAARPDAAAPAVAATLARLLTPGGETADARLIAGRLERSLLIGSGRLAPDAFWALGESWRSIYPAIVARLGARGLDEADWPRFRRLAAEMERIAFGPPIVNAAKLLALIEHGVVDLSYCAGGAVLPGSGAGKLRSAAGATSRIDVLIDAVSPPPGALHLRSGPIADLRAQGAISIPAGRRGVAIAEDAQCLDGDGRRTEGLFALGRLSEDWVIGNDTLNRSLHGHSDRWARSVVRRARAGRRPYTATRRERTVTGSAVGR